MIHNTGRQAASEMEGNVRSLGVSTSILIVINSTLVTIPPRSSYSGEQRARDETARWYIQYSTVPIKRGYIYTAYTGTYMHVENIMFEREAESIIQPSCTQLISIPPTDTVRATGHEPQTPVIRLASSMSLCGFFLYSMFIMTK